MLCVLTVGGTSPNLHQSYPNGHFNFNVSFSDRWIPNGHVSVGFGVRWINALTSTLSCVSSSDTACHIEVGVRQVIESSVAPSPCGDFLDHLGILQRLWGTQNTLGAFLLMPVNALIWVIALTKTQERGVRAHAREIRCGFFGARACVNVMRRGDTQNDARYAAQGRTHARALNPGYVQASSLQYRSCN